MKTIGILGLGIIGRAWARRYAAAGVLAGTWNRTPQADAPSALPTPEAVAAAAFEFIAGPLRTDPHRVGKPLREPLAPLWSARRGEYRVLYRILEHRLVIEVVSVVHRRDAYRR